MDKTVSESGKQRQNMCIQNSKGGPVLTLKIPFRSSSKIRSGHALLQPRLTHKISKEYLFSNSCVSNQCFNELRIRQTLKSRFSVWQRKLSNCKSTKVILRPQGAAVSLQQEGSHQEQGDRYASTYFTSNYSSQQRPSMPDIPRHIRLTTCRQHAHSVMHCINPAHT